MKRCILVLLAAVALGGCSDSAGSSSGTADADLSDTGGTDVPERDADLDTRPPDVGDSGDSGRDAADVSGDGDLPDDAVDAPDTADATDTADAPDTEDATDTADAPDAPTDLPDDDASDADVPPDDADAGPDAPPAVQWAQRRGLAVSGKRALVLLDGRGRPVVVGPRGGVSVVAYEPDGTERWTLSLFSDPATDVAAAMGPDDVLYLFFDFRSLTIDGERVQAQDRDLALVAVSDAGDVLWHEIWASEESERAVGLGVDDAGRIYVAGHGDNGDLEIGGARVHDWPSRFQDSWEPAHFVVALGADRQQRWSFSYRLLDVQFSALTTAPDGTTYVGGGVRTDLDFGSGPTGDPVDGIDIVFAAFDADGENLWTTRLPEESGGEVLSLGVDGQGRLLATAALTGNRITSSNLPSISNRAGGTLLAFDPQGVERYRHSWAVGSLWVGSRNEGGPVLSGHTLFDAVDLGGGTLPRPGEHDAILAGFDDDGAHVWSLAVGTRNREVFTGAARDPQTGEVFAAGVATGGGTPDYGAGPTETMSNFDTLVVGFGLPE